MKLLFVTRNLPPLHGGIERLMPHAVEALAGEWQCHVVGPRGCRAFLPPSVRVTELPASVPAFLALAAPVVAVLALRHRFRLCVAANGLVAPLAALAAALSRCPWLAFVHGLDLVAPSRVYQALFVPLLRGARLLIANSRHVADVAARRGVPRDRIRVLAPGVALPPEPPPRAPGRPPRLLSVGRLVERKGLAEFVERSLPRVLQRFADARYVIVGAEPEHAAVSGRGTRQRIAAAAESAGAQAQVELAGAVSDADLARHYAAADVLVFPSRGGGGDVEGFGMVVVEAAAHGVPTVAFDVGGVADAMSGDNGVLVPEDDYAAFADAVIALLEGRSGVTAASCRAHAASYGWERYRSAVRDCARDAIRG